MQRRKLALDADVALFGIDSDRKVIQNYVYDVVPDLARVLRVVRQGLIIGNQNAITYKEIFPLLMRNEMWIGYKFGDMALVVSATLITIDISPT